MKMDTKDDVLPALNFRQIDRLNPNIVIERDGRFCHISDNDLMLNPNIVIERALFYSK